MLIIPPIRGVDSQGSGAFGASRGSRKHNGVDVACYAGSRVLAIRSGKVTKIGYPYPPSNRDKGHLRYVEIGAGDRRYRYFYVAPLVSVGDEVDVGTIIGEAQGLTRIYPGITDHIHIEIMLPDGSFMDPTNLVKGAV